MTETFRCGQCNIKQDEDSFTQHDSGEICNKCYNENLEAQTNTYLCKGCHTIRRALLCAGEYIDETCDSCANAIQDGFLCSDCYTWATPNTTHHCDIPALCEIGGEL